VILLKRYNVRNVFANIFSAQGVSMKTITVTALFFLLIANAAALDYEPYTYTQDFETRELMAWSSYPPIQDTAYEAPYIYPGTIVPGDVEIALCKLIYPDWDAPQLTGVVKRLNIRLDKNSRIRFRYYIKTTLKPSWFGIDLPLKDGSRVRSRFEKPQVNRWVSVDLGIADIEKAAGRNSSEILDITAIAITVHFGNTDPDIPIELGFDDFSITGHRETRFVFEEPETQSLKEFRSEVALKHYRHGDTLIIRGDFPHSNPEAVTADIARFDKPDLTIAAKKLKKVKNSWQTGKPITLDAGTFPAGMYEVTLTGTRKKETTAQSTFTFMIIDNKFISGHPRLWFDKESIDSFISKLKKPKNAPMLDHIRADADGARDKYSLELPYDLDYFPKKGWLKSFEPYRTRISTIPQRTTANALMSVIDGNKDAAEWAKKALVSLCRWPTWTHPWMENRGHHIYLYQYYTTYNLALAYDMLYDNLTESEREIVRTAFIRNGLKPAFRTYVEADMCTCNESNWITAIVGGSLVASCAILGELEDTSEFEPYLSGCFYKLRAHMETVYNGDSACIEGFGYGYGTIRIYSEILPIIERSLNMDFSHMFNHQYTEGFWAADHDAGLYFTFGDAHTSAPNTSFAPWLIEKFRDPELAWFHDLNPPQPTYYNMHTVLFDIDDVPRKEPSYLSGAKWFRETGTVVFRSGPGPEPFVLTFRCGPFGNHQHLDQGSFFLADRGNVLLTEMGYSNYYDDPYYQSHVIQPVGHNCILIDNNPQSQRTGDHEEYAVGMSDHAKITTFVGGKNLSFALGDLSPVYLGNVKKLERGILYIPPRTALVIDRFETKEGEADMQVLFHSPKFSNTYIHEGNGFAIGSDNMPLIGHVVFPWKPELSFEPDPVKLAHFTDEPIEPMGRVTVTAKTKNKNAIIATILSTDMKLWPIKQDHFSSYIDFDKLNVLINSTGTLIDEEGIVSDGLLAAAGDDGGFLMVDGTFGSLHGTVCVSTDKPVTVLFESDTVYYSAVEPATLQLRPAGKVQAVILNGEKMKKWRMDKKTGLISFDVEAGQGEVNFQ